MLLLCITKCLTFRLKKINLFYDLIITECIT
nr:MAG TPA: hypothetical protein [Caudoviricetes sp.]